MINRNAGSTISYLTKNKKKVSSGFYDDQMISALYSRKNMIFSRPYTLSAFTSRKFSTVIPADYWDLDKEVKQNDVHLSNTTYIDFMTDTYIRFLYKKMMFTQGILDSTQSVEEYAEMIYKLIEEEP